MLGKVPLSLRAMRVLLWPTGNSQVPSLSEPGTKEEVQRLKERYRYTGVQALNAPSLRGLSDTSATLSVKNRRTHQKCQFEINNKKKKIRKRMEKREILLQE